MSINHGLQTYQTMVSDLLVRCDLQSQTMACQFRQNIKLFNCGLTYCLNRVTVLRLPQVQIIPYYDNLLRFIL